MKFIIWPYYHIYTWYTSSHNILIPCWFTQPYKQTYHNQWINYTTSDWLGPNIHSLPYYLIFISSCPSTQTWNTLTLLNLSTWCLFLRHIYSNVSVENIILNYKITLDGLINFLNNTKVLFLSFCSEFTVIYLGIIPEKQLWSSINIYSNVNFFLTI